MGKKLRQYLSFCVLAVLLSLSGCRYWYKPGSDAADLQRDEAECQARTGAPTSEPAFADCMRALGWSGSQAHEPASGQAALQQKNEASTITSGTAPGKEHTEPSSPTGSSDTPRRQPPAHQPDVTSWWKLGGTPGQLEQDQQRCRKELGKTGQGDDVEWRISREFQSCMQKRGWRAQR